MGKERTMHRPAATVGSTDPHKETHLLPRWTGIERPYTSDDVQRLRGTLRVAHSLAAAGAERLWHLLHARPLVPALGALTGEIGRAHV